MQTECNYETIKMDAALCSLYFLYWRFGCLQLSELSKVALQCAASAVTWKQLIKKPKKFNRVTTVHTQHIHVIFTRWKRCYLLLGSYE